ncbi:MAG: DsbA family protein [Bauldia sp.]
MKFDRRHLLIGGGAAAVVLAGGAYYLSNAQTVTLPFFAPPEPKFSMAAGSEMMVPGPLGERVLGSDKAPVTIIEYASMTCPHCQNFHATTYPVLKAKYIDTGKVRFIFREFPLDGVATAAAMLARCAPPEKYFPLVDLMFDHQEEWAGAQDRSAALFNLVKQTGYTQEAFNACLQNQTVLAGVNSSRERASTKFTVNSTPTFFINGKKVSGDFSVEELDKLVLPLLQ